MLFAAILSRHDPVGTAVVSYRSILMYFKLPRSISAYFARLFQMFFRIMSHFNRAFGLYLKPPTRRVALVQSVSLPGNYILQTAPSINTVQEVTDALGQINCRCIYLTIERPFWPLDPPHAQMLHLCRHLHLLIRLPGASNPPCHCRLPAVS